MAKLSSTDIYGDLYVDGIISGVLNGSVNNNLIVKLNSGTTEGTNQFTFNGSAAKTVNITPSGIGALPSSGGQLSGKLYMPATATSTDASHPTQLAYGLLGSYGTLKVLGNTDTSAGADNEYVHIAAGWGLSPAADKGIAVYGTYANCFGKKISTEGHTHSSYAYIDDGLKSWGCSIKCATWSRLFYFKSDNTTTGGSFIFNIRGTRSSVVYDATFMVNFSHSQKCKIVQLNNSEYSNVQVRGITKDGEGYIEIYDNVNGATNTTTQNVSISFIRLSNMSLTTYTAFTDGSTIPSGFAENAKLTTVSGSYYSGTAANATKLATARTINGTSFDGSANITTANWGTARTLTIGDSGKSVNGSANVSWSLSEIGAAPTSHNHTSLTGITSLAFGGIDGSDTISITTSNSSATSYMDFNMTDDANSDMWRWRFTAWDSSTNANAATFNAMTLMATSTTKAKLTVNGSIAADSFNGLNFWTGTQAAYNSLSSKSATTVYFITG